MRIKCTKILTLLMVLLSTIAMAQIQVSGVVKDADGEPLPGAYVESESGESVETDIDGKYTITANEGEKLTFSFIGMDDKIQAVSGSSLSVTMGLGAGNKIGETIVVGYQKKDPNKLLENVSVIEESQIEDLVVNSVQEVLQGQASGVQLTNSSGLLGANPIMRIRGVGSLTGDAQPLIVVDGVPMASGSGTTDDLTTQQGASMSLNPFGNINPDDIASMTVLKDAAATSIYGSRAANGVILVTTKKGKKGKPVFTLDISSLVNQPTDIMDMMSGDQYRDFTGVTTEGNYDWVDNVLKTGSGNKLYLSARGGTDNVRYFASVNYANQEGIIIANDMESLGGRINLDTDVNDWLNVGMNLSLNRNRFNRVNAENNIFSPVTGATLLQPYLEPYQEDGSYTNTGFIRNPIAYSKEVTNELRSTRTIGNVFANVKLLKGLTFKTDWGIDRMDNDQLFRMSSEFTSGGDNNTFLAKLNSYVITNTLNYTKSINNKHNFDVLFGQSFEENEYTASWIDVAGFAFDNLLYSNNASTIEDAYLYREKATLFSLFSKFSYDYEGKYLISGTIRRDGSSKFAPNHRYGNFWSVGAGWVLTNETFMEDGFFDYLKLRASYGTSGNSDLPRYYGSFAQMISSDYNGDSGFTLDRTNPGNPDLKWEESKMLDIGFNSTFLNNRVDFSVNYYQKDTDDLIISNPLSNTLGLFSVDQNIGKMRNKGWEFDLSTVNIKSDNFKWTTSLNLSFNDNEIKSLPNAEVDYLGNRYVRGDDELRAVEGMSANTFYLVRYAGVNPETGDAQWLTRDGEITTTYSSNDAVYVDEYNPDFTGGFTTNFKYKNWDLSALFNFSYGGNIYVESLEFTDNPNSSFNKRVELLNQWQSPGDKAYVPSSGSSTIGNFASPSTLFLKDSSYLRFKNITLGYTLPSEFLDKLGIDAVRLYFTGSNMFTIKDSELDGIDPEVTDDDNPLVQGKTFFAAPQAKTYTFGVRINL